MKHKLIALVAGALLAFTAYTVQAGVQNWEEDARYFSMLFASNSTVVVANYFEDGSFVIADEFGHTYKGCEVGAPCDTAIEYTQHVYMPAVSK